MNKLPFLFIFYLVNMSLFTWFWIILGLEWKKKIYRILLFIILAALILTICIPFGKFGHFISYLLTILLANVIFTKSFKRIFIDIFFIIYIFYFIQSIQILLYRKLYPDLEVYLLYINSSMNSIFILNFVTFILILLVWLSNKLTRLLIDYKMVLENNPKLIAFMGMSLVLLQLNSEFNYEVFWDKYYLFFLIICTLFYLNFIYIKKSIDIFEHKKEIELHKKHNEIICELIEDAKKRQHEFKNHLTTIYSLQQLEENTDNIKKYIKSVNESINIFPDIYKLNNKIIAAVIHSKIGFAEKHNIKFELHLNYIVQFPVADYQLVEIISNLLNNAFEALQNSESLEKKVVLEINETQGNPFIIVKNNEPALLPSDIPMIFNPGFSKKSHSRGYGLYNIKKIVKRTNGQIEVHLDKEYIIFKVSFSRTGGSI